MRGHVALALLVVAGLARPVLASPAVTLLDGPAFAARVTGHTVIWTREGEDFGVEQYLDGNRVIWRRANGTCEHGHWAPDGPRICFHYEGNPGPICWLFADEGGQLIARSLPADVGDLLRSRDENAAPLSCAPNVGV